MAPKGVIWLSKSTSIYLNECFNFLHVQSQAHKIYLNSLIAVTIIKNTVRIDILLEAVLVKGYMFPAGSHVID